MTSRVDNRPEDWRQLVSPENRSNHGRIRRMLIGVTSRVLWQLIGHRDFAGKRETHDAPVFGVPGVVSRPGGRNAEAFVAFAGEGASSPGIIGVRDPEQFAAIVAALENGELGKGETAIGAGTEGSVACLMHWRAVGTIEARSPGGTAHDLALKADIEAIKTAADAAVTFGDFKAALAALGVAWPAGTTVLKGE